MPRWISSTSAIWSPTENTGFSEVIGSWKIMPTRLPRSLRSASASSDSTSAPSTTMRPPVISHGRRRQQADRGERGQRLAAAGFADEPEHLAGLEAEAHILDKRALPDLQGEALDGEDVVVHAAFQNSPPGIGCGTPVVVGRLSGRPRIERTAR